MKKLLFVSLTFVISTQAHAMCLSFFGYSKAFSAVRPFYGNDCLAEPKDQAAAVVRLGSYIDDPEHRKEVIQSLYEVVTSQRYGEARATAFQILLDHVTSQDEEILPDLDHSEGMWPVADKIRSGFSAEQRTHAIEDARSKVLRGDTYFALRVWIHLAGASTVVGDLTRILNDPSSDVKLRVQVVEMLLNQPLKSAETERSVLQAWAQHPDLSDIILTSLISIRPLEESALPEFRKAVQKWLQNDAGKLSDGFLSLDISIIESASGNIPIEQNFPGLIQLAIDKDVKHDEIGQLIRLSEKGEDGDRVGRRLKKIFVKKLPSDEWAQTFRAEMNADPKVLSDVELSENLRIELADQSRQFSIKRMKMVSSLILEQVGRGASQQAVAVLSEVLASLNLATYQGRLTHSYLANYVLRLSEALPAEPSVIGLLSDVLEQSFKTGETDELSIAFRNRAIQLLYKMDSSADLQKLVTMVKAGYATRVGSRQPAHLAIPELVNYRAYALRIMKALPASEAIPEREALLHDMISELNQTQQGLTYTQAALAQRNDALDLTLALGLTSLQNLVNSTLDRTLATDVRIIHGWSPRMDTALELLGEECEQKRLEGTSALKVFMKAKCNGAIKAKLTQIVGSSEVQQGHVEKAYDILENM